MIYEKILEIAKKKEISISKLERDSGLSKGAISKWKNGNPTVDNLKAVANVLEVPIEKLLAE